MIRSARDFGNLVRTRRKAMGITQAELAARIGSGERFVVDLESGKPSCQLEKSLLAAVEVGIQLSAEPPEHPQDDDELAHVPSFR